MSTIIEKPLAIRIQVVTALVALTPFLKNNPKPQRSSGIYREWRKGSKKARPAVPIGAIPRDELGGYGKNALKKLQVLVAPDRKWPQEQFTLSWELVQKGIIVYQGGKYEKSVQVSSSLSGMKAEVDEAVILAKDFCLHYATYEETIAYAHISGNESLVRELLDAAIAVRLDLYAK